METNKLVEFFEENNLLVFLYEQDNIQCAELESWTNGGVDMIINLSPFTANEFKSYVNDFDIDEVIDNLRKDKEYCNVFGVKQSLNDITDYYTNLTEIANKL